jgi:hypothetical protein
MAHDRMDQLEEKLEGNRIAVLQIAHTQEQILEHLVRIHAKLDQVPRVPKRRVWLALAMSTASFGLGVLAHWRIGSGG